MILSVSLLTGFSGYWLRNQFQQEKRHLAEILKIEYNNARDEVLDSMLFTTYIRPILEDSLVLSIEIDNSCDSLTVIKNKTPAQLDVRKLSSGAVTVDSIHSMGNAGIFKRIELDSLPERLTWNENNMLIRSFKMILSHASDSTGRDSLFLVDFSDEKVEELLHRNFTGNLTERGLNFTLRWPDDSSGENKIRHGGIIIGKGSSPAVYNVMVKRTNPFILKRILPQILFVIFLISLTTTAFTFTFRTMKKQYELNLIRKDFISNMTHELKTPVSTMKVAMEAIGLYDAKQDPGKAAEYMEMANGEINRLDQLIARILDHVHLEEDTKTLKLEKTDLAELAGECLRILSPRAEKENAVLEFNPAKEACIIKCDRWYIRSVIINIIDNSLKYSQAKPHITVTTGCRNDRVNLEVRDNGPGIPPEYSEKIFEKFFRVPKGNIHDVKGHGLGLSLAALVMKMHNAKITQRNLDGGGCSFLLEFKNAADED